MNVNHYNMIVYASFVIHIHYLGFVCFPFMKNDASLSILALLYGELSIATLEGHEPHILVC